MKNQVISIKGGNYQVFGFNEIDIVFSSKHHTDFESLIASDIKPRLFESVMSIPMKSVYEITYNEKEKLLYFKYKYFKNKKKISVKLSDKHMIKTIAHSIAILNGFSKIMVKESKIRPLLNESIWLFFLIPLVTIGLRDMAIDAQNGLHYEVTSKRANDLKQLIVDVVEMMNPEWITYLGILAFCSAVYLAYNRYSNPALNIIYS